jgi:hypothetical protein
MRTLSAVMSELSFAARRLAADRWAACAAILAVAIGAGLNTAVFATAYGILLRPLPFADPARLVVMDVERRVSGMQLGVRLDEFEEWRRELRGFDSMVCVRHPIGLITRHPDQFPRRIAGWPAARRH